MLRGVLCTFVLRLPPECERPILERFLRAEAMAMYSVRSAQANLPAEASVKSGIPAHALEFLRRHEEEERKHLGKFEDLTGIRAREKTVLPRLPRQWHACAVHLYGYEALGLEFARLLAGLRPDLAHILADEETHVSFFEHEIRRILAPPRPGSGQAGQGPSNAAREFARAWIRRLPKTVGRYLQGPELEPYREELSRRILAAIEARFISVGLLGGASGRRG